MAWFSGKVSLGGFPDFAGAVNKLQESVKNIEKNFDTALGFEEKPEKSDSNSEASGLWSSPTNRKTLFDPVMAFMGQKNEEKAAEFSGETAVERSPPKTEKKEEVESPKLAQAATEHSSMQEEKELPDAGKDDGHWQSDERAEKVDPSPSKAAQNVESAERPESTANVEFSDSIDNRQPEEIPETAPVQVPEALEVNSEVEVEKGEARAPERDVQHDIVDAHEISDEQKMTPEDNAKGSPSAKAEMSTDSYPEDKSESFDSHSFKAETEAANESDLPSALPSEEIQERILESAPVEVDTVVNDSEEDESQQSSSANVSHNAEALIELKRVKTEMKMMESALQGAARQAQAKADEIAKLMNENERLKAVVEDLKRKSNEAEIESLREEYHQRVATLERKVYALTKERDTLRREQSKKSDAAALLKEKDEIINQVMAEGEELSKKQAAQESQIRKLRAQIRELEEEKKGLITKLQAEENKVESIKKDKAATEKLLEETIEKHQTELAAQKEYYTNALNAAKEAEALAEERANNEARTELQSRLREAEEREAMLVQTLEELRQTLSRQEQQASFKEDMLRRDIEDLQKRYQASERRCEELITQVPESTRPLLRQIEAMQETNARRAEAWAAVERSLNARVQEAEAKAAAAEERERSVNERLSQTLSRINVLEAQISCLRAEQSQLSKSLEKERQRAAENRQEYLAAKEEADTQEARANQLEEEIREIRQTHKQELQEGQVHRELLQQELEREKAARLETERTARLHSANVSDQVPIARQSSNFENGATPRKLSHASSLGSMEESYFLQASLDSSDGLSERRNTSEATISPYYMKSMTPSAFEATLRQKEGELASYMSRLASMESIRDSLAEELVQMTAKCEKLRAEAAMLPGIRAELEALRQRHSAALELMGERDEELEELRADIVDLKEMYREQVNLLVNKIQSVGSNPS